MRWGLKEALGKTASRRTEISYKGRVPVVSEHNITKPVADPGNTVNEAVVQGKFTLLSGEISYSVRHERTIGKATTREGI